MARSDQGYRRGRVRYVSMNGPRSKSLSTYISKARKDEVVDMMLRTQKKGILDILGIDPTSDIGVKIRQGIADAAERPSGSAMTKADMEAAIRAQNKGLQAFNRGVEDRELREGAETLIAALQSATKDREADNLDEGDWLDDLPTLMIDGSSWGEDVTGAPQYKKHVNIAVDNSGSTHMSETGYCSIAMQDVASSLKLVLHGAGYEFPGITWDEFSFNRTTIQHTGAYGRRYREELVRQSLEHTIIHDPLDRDARETNLAPLMKQMYDNEASLGLLNTPRLDIILTDGEWETQEDADEAGKWQRMRGTNATTYVLNLCPETIGDIALPANFRVIPVNCITETQYGRKRVDNQILRQTIMSIVIQEAQNL